MERQAREAESRKIYLQKVILPKTLRKVFQKRRKKYMQDFMTGLITFKLNK